MQHTFTMPEVPESDLPFNAVTDLAKRLKQHDDNMEYNASHPDYHKTGKGKVNQPDYDDRYDSKYPKRRAMRQASEAWARSVYPFYNKRTDAVHHAFGDSEHDFIIIPRAAHKGGNRSLHAIFGRENWKCKWSNMAVRRWLLHTLGCTVVIVHDTEVTELSGWNERDEALYVTKYPPKLRQWDLF